MQPPDTAQVRAALEHVLASPAFINAGRLSRMLRFVVERTLDGQGDQLKEYLLGVEVFDRPPDYDPRLDSIVRVEARRLRAKLSEYYDAEGARDAVRIRMGKGGYLPTFERANGSPPPPMPGGDTRRRFAPVAVVVLAVMFVALLAGAALWWRGIRSAAPPAHVTSIAVLPFHVFSGRDQDRRVADQLADGVTTELARVPSLGVASHTSASQYRDPQMRVQEIAQTLDVAVVMEATAHVDGPMVRLEVRLVDARAGRKLWVQDFVGQGDNLDGLEQEVSRAVAAFLLARGGDSPP